MGVTATAASKDQVMCSHSLELDRQPIGLGT